MSECADGRCGRSSQWFMFTSSNLWIAREKAQRSVKDSDTVLVTGLVR
jgi:hypothetical protein